MIQRFKDDFVSREHRFSLGTDQETGGTYLSTPVSGFTAAAEWEAYFAITGDQFARFRADPSTADDFTEDCRMGRNRKFLIYPR
jgi:hypothetical protein